MKLVSLPSIEPHLQLLATLFRLLQTIRRKGLMSIESDIESPKESSEFNAVAPYDSNNEAVYTFVCDVFRLMTSALLNATEIARYAEAYSKTTILTVEQESLFETARLTILATLEGNAPSIAIEYGRQGIPAPLKPSFQEVEDFIRSIRKEPEPSREQVRAKLSVIFSEGKGR